MHEVRICPDRGGDRVMPPTQIGVTPSGCRAMLGQAGGFKTFLVLSGDKSELVVRLEVADVGQSRRG